MAGLLSFGLNILADIFYPKYCFGCQRPGNYLCKFCMSQVPSMAKSFCIVCNSQSAQGFTHQTCKSKFSPDRLLSAFPYQYIVIADMIITGKYYFIPETFVILGAMLADTLYDRLNESSFVVCAVPLHSRRLRWRGFNQSEVAAKVFAQGLKLPYFPILQRTKNTKTQKDLPATQREINIKNAFYCSIKSNIPERVLLLDDVCTTGKTLIEATKALKQAGVKTVWCVSIAKD